jgi:hypothetical protein
MGIASQRADAVFFIDPPYTVAGRRLYKYSAIDHHKLFEVATHLVGDFLMTYDNVNEIRWLAREFGLDTEKVPMKNTLPEVEASAASAHCFDSLVAAFQQEGQTSAFLGTQGMHVGAMLLPWKYTA